jgi:catechol 2,3-dioxygenase-like lactoylglutathione lyase family enzyme
MSDDDFYTRPILSVRDVRSSIAYYCDKLGFEKSWDSGDETLVIAQVGRNGLDIILDAESVIPRAAVPSVLSMSVSDLEALHKELQDREAKITAAPFAVQWQEGINQFDVEDLDGNVLVFWGDEPAGQTA